ncbi:N-acetylglutaminylglutamine amidotransferase [Azospirillum thermophilum]|uniref:asparagine synthase (glutamine-hydrolyzing) n=1 Tax=Azospirillum thermophilum TaxID=2202148 RepID=A0A2S2CW68_9PROT|nr:N-acetylglutaminylglutamine amidotransferase [Azospirillum thermophilum]AWK88773.1 N-acetylglutaminylglutamine amidotransferase [Azospirillum thermophilum]
MCGISGEIRFDDSPASASAVGAMTEALARRGPDGQGIFVQGRVAFGHRRLSIIDLSQASQQPMVDPDLGLGIVFNGCIYNYPELRAELEGRGYRFFSHGDTEVLLKAYHAWGPRFVERLYGMFAFAIWERDSGRVTLGRDRLGIKPLYIAETPGRLRFASSLPALVAGGDVDTGIDPVALHHYMSFHAVVPAPLTILKGVRKLPPATLLTLEPDGTRREETYWTLAFGPQPGDERLSGRDWQDAVLATLRKAVERRLVADVPVGVLLSGGLDSSLIVALLAEAGQSGLETFSIGFETVGQERGDEFQYSDLIADRFGTDHHKLFIDSSRALPALQECVRAMAEPMVSHDAIGFFLLSQEVARHVKVVQSGQGADEIFAGYHWYPPMMDAADPVAAYARVFFDRDHAEMAQALDPRYLAGEDVSRAFVAAHFARPGADRPVDKALRLDTTVMLVDDPVKRVDNMTMAWGLEGRVPFLDHDVVELAARIPPELKLRDGGKFVLKEAARQVVPAEVIDRPKGYFPVPALKYLRGPYLDLVRDVLNQPAARERSLFRPAYLDTLFRDPETHITPLRGSKLWQVALLEFWLQTQGI